MAEENPLAVIREALLFSERNLGRLGNNAHEGYQDGDDALYEVPGEAVASLEQVEAERLRYRTALDRIASLDDADAGEHYPATTFDVNCEVCIARQALSPPTTDSEVP